MTEFPLGLKIYLTGSYHDIGTFIPSDKDNRKSQPEKGNRKTQPEKGNRKTQPEKGNRKSQPEKGIQVRNK